MVGGAHGVGDLAPEGPEAFRYPKDGDIADDRIPPVEHFEVACGNDTPERLLQRHNQMWEGEPEKSDAFSNYPH